MRWPVLLLALSWPLAMPTAVGKEIFYRCKAGTSYAYSPSPCKSDDGSPPQCKGPKGWTPDACEAAESAAQADAARAEGVPKDSAPVHKLINPDAAEQSTRDKFAQFCRDAGVVEIHANIDCTEEQLQAYGWLGELAKTLAKDSDEERKLTSCLMRYTNTTNGALDAKMAKLCYALP